LNGRHKFLKLVWLIMAVNRPENIGVNKIKQLKINRPTVNHLGLRFNPFLLKIAHSKMSVTKKSIHVPSPAICKKRKSWVRL